MEGYTANMSPPNKFVRARYDYVADDPTSLSMRKDDIIQVLTELDTGWWDGIINGVRGWFPSNYCTPIVLAPRRDFAGSGGDDTDLDAEFEDQYEDDELDAQEEAGLRQNGAAGHAGQEEAPFWIPQATPDGRLFYFNTLTGDSTMELPLESSTSTNQTPPRTHANAFAVGQARPARSSQGRGYQGDEDTDQSASEAEGNSGFASHRRRSCLSDGASPATSMESLFEIAPPHVMNTPKPNYPLRANDSSFIGTPTMASRTASLAQRHLAPAEPLTLTWDRMVDDMRRSIERYRQALHKAESSDYVPRAEDISDHLRLILTAGSSTTDNHSGNPSIISSNRALYPHFRDMMSRFSKLVLSSHIAAADETGGESRQKCLHEAKGVLEAVYGYVEVARQQRGEDIPRLVPGFVGGQLHGGNWRGNGLQSMRAPDTSFASYEDDEAMLDPNVYLSSSELDNFGRLESAMFASSQALEKRLYVKDDVISHKKHNRLSDDICAACEILVNECRPWITALESINLTVLSLPVQNQLLSTFETQKQRIYAMVADLIFACQAVAAPLSDEWAQDRGDSLDERLKHVRSTLNELRAATSDVHNTIQAFYETLPSQSNSQEPPRGMENNRRPPQMKPLNPTIRPVPPSETSPSYLLENGVGMAYNAESAKVKKFFGEMPVTSPTREQQEDLPWFIRLDHENEVLYDQEKSPPFVRGGTMLGLVEQLTRQDRFDASFTPTFLLTYQSFTTAQELFEFLIYRWDIQPPPGLNKEEYGHWVEKKQAPIRFRIVNVLKMWLDQYWMENTDMKSKELIQRIYNFARDTIAMSGLPGARPLMIIIEQRMRGEETASRRLVPNSSVEAPASILPKNLKKIKLLEIDPLEFARQLTIIESRLYGRIKPQECLNKIWQKKSTSQDVEPAANVKSLILHSNRLTNWVAEMILNQQDIKKRVAVIKHFIMVADKCLSVSNFSTLTSIISAFATAPVTRLTRTWIQVNAKVKDALEKLRALMSPFNNFMAYREALHSSNPPCIPFFGVYLTDLTFIEDGLSTNIPRTDLINFSKRVKTAEVIREIQTYQNATYPFKSVPELQDYVLSMMQAAGDVNEMYDKSLQLEPREREDEKIARLLSESGFL